MEYTILNSNKRWNTQFPSLIYVNGEIHNSQVYSSTLIDVLFTTNKLKITNSGAIHVGLSDHSLIYATLGITNTKAGGHTYKASRSYGKLVEEHFLHDIANVKWNCILGTSNIDASLDVFETLFISVCDKHAPCKKRKVRQTLSPWLNQDIFDLIHKRDHSKKMAITLKRDDSWKT